MITQCHLSDVWALARDSVETLQAASFGASIPVRMTQGQACAPM